MRQFKYFFVLILVTACFAQEKPQQPEPEILIQLKEPPPGLDRKSFLKADSLFSLANVSEINQKIASEYFKQAREMRKLCDSLWAFYSKKEKVYSDTSLAYQWYDQALAYLSTTPYEFGSIVKKAKKYGKLDSTVLKDIVLALIPQISKTYGNAIRYNRFMANYFHDFANFLRESYMKTGDVSFVDQAISQHEEVLKLNKGRRVSYVELGNLYFIKKQWNKAFENYKKAAEILRASAIFTISDPENYFDRLHDVPFDTAKMVNYLSSQAECKIHLYEAQPSLALLRAARKMTSDPRLKDQFKKRIKWILWDDGNIRASEFRNEAFEIYAKGDYETAKLKLLELLDILWTQKTRDEINYRIAQIDFLYLKKEEEGVTRLFQVIKHSEKDSLTGAAVDSMHQIYFNSYGRMCFNLGTRFLDVDKTYSYVYFYQAANIAYDERPLAYIQLADLSLFQPEESIELCKKALQKEDHLDESARTALYKVLYAANRRLGRFDKAKNWYEKWKNLAN